MDIKVSLIASAVRHLIWEPLFKSLEGTSVSYEIVFAGNNETFTKDYTYLSDKKLRYLKTEDIKPAQCYEIARRGASGEVIVWVADDCEFPNNIIGKAHDYWKSQNNDKLILSIQTKESGYNLPIGQLFDMDMHRFFGFRKDTPLMAPLALMSRRFLNELGGFDRRYVCGQYENDVVMRAYILGGKVEIFGDQDNYIDIDHLGKSLLLKESRTQADFLNRPFAKGYAKDREVLESSWVNNGKVSIIRNDIFEPYESGNILTLSQSNKGHWI